MSTNGISSASRGSSSSSDALPAPLAPRIKVHVDSQCQADARDIAKHSPRGGFSTTTVLICSLFVYLMVCGLFTTSTFLQSQLVYLHAVRWPLGDLTNLARFGIVEGRSVTLHMNSSSSGSTGEGDTLQGYHLLPPGPDVVAAMSMDQGRERDLYFEEKLQSASNIVIYLHGNGATRAHHRRIAVQKHISAYCNAHVLTFDYRGFGDSVGTPSELGTVDDVGAIIGYLQGLDISKSAKVFLYAESLGTGIAIAYLSAHPEMTHAAGGVVNGLILLAPFVSLPEAALSHPAAAPFRVFPVLKTYMLQHLHFKYPSIETVASINLPLLCIHGTSDVMIPVAHGKRLFDTYVAGRPQNKTCVSSDSRSTESVIDNSVSCPSGSSMEPSKYIEIDGAGHDNLFNAKEWLLEVPAFISAVP